MSPQNVHYRKRELPHSTLLEVQASPPSTSASSIRQKLSKLKKLGFTSGISMGGYEQDHNLPLPGV